MTKLKVRSPINSTWAWIVSAKHSRLLTWIAVAGVVLLLALAVVLIVSLVAEVIFGRNFAWMPSAHHDFLAFYTTAHLTMQGSIARIYDPLAQTAYQRTIINHPIGAAGFMPYLNPPFVAVLLAPLALMREGLSRVIWLGINAAILISSVIYLLRVANVPRKAMLLPAVLIACTFPAYQALVEGQVSILLLGGCVLSYSLYRSKNALWAGVTLGALWLKPQLALVALAQLLWIRQFKAAWGLVIGGAVITLVCFPLTGISLNMQYLGFLASVASDHLQGAGALHPALAWSGSLGLTEGVNGLFVWLLGQKSTLPVNALTLLFDAGLGVIFLVSARRAVQMKAEFSYLIVIGVLTAILVDPHLYAQDLVVLILLLPAAVEITRSRSLGVLALATLLATATIDQLAGFHLFTLAALCLVILAFARIRLHQSQRDPSVPHKRQLMEALHSSSASTR